MKKTIAAGDGRIFDIYLHRFGSAILDISIYKVKHPNHKRFFRTELFSFYSAHVFIDDYDTIEQCLSSILQKGLEAEAKEKEREKKIEDFFRDNEQRRE